MTVDLDPDPEILWKGFKTEHRQHIRRGYKNGFTAKLGDVELLDDFYKVCPRPGVTWGRPSTRRATWIPSRRHFPACSAVCRLRRRKACRGLVSGLRGGTAEGLWLGSLAKHRHDYAGYVLYWELLKDAAVHGCKQFHLGRSTVQSGGRAFQAEMERSPNAAVLAYCSAAGGTFLKSTSITPDTGLRCGLATPSGRRHHKSRADPGSVYSLRESHSLRVNVNGRPPRPWRTSIARRRPHETWY